MKNTDWISAAESNIGTVRKVNEDDFYDAPQAQLWCVADGMGGHSRGDLASRMVTHNLLKLVATDLDALSVSKILTCLESVNRDLVALSSEHQSIVGSTVVVLFFADNQAHVIWAGDSRIYRLRRNRIERLTRDHSQVEDMIDAGLIRPEEAETHPKANVITRAVGASHHLELDVRSFEIEPEDQFFLCSDGLNKVMSDREIEHVLQTVPTDQITNHLIDTALARKARDNVTVLVVRNATSKGDNLQKTLPLDDTLPLDYSHR